jgi:phytoene dehydrogenase-like protein
MVELRDAMVACQTHYEKFQRDGSDNASAGPWMRSLRRIAGVIEEFDRILETFGPEARETMRRYLDCDSKYAREREVFVYTAGRMEADDMGVDYRNEKLAASFTSALGELDKFIRSTFKPEEIHAARKSRLDPSCHLSGL